jgi:hypothetical protein
MNEVSICNAALSYLGEKGTITRIKPPEGNPMSEACAEYYPQALRYLLEAHNWAFAIRRVRLPEYKKYDADLYQWAHGYQVPSDYLRTVKVYEKSSQVDEAGIDFEIETLSETGSFILLTDSPAPMLRYVASVQNVSIMPQYFIQALVLQLASYLAGPLMKTSMAQQMIQMAAQALETAKYQDSRNSIRVKHEYLAPHLAARSI